MRLETLLNNVVDYKLFNIKSSKIIQEHNEKKIIAEIKPRKNSTPICSICNEKSTIYDTRKSRLFQFVPIFNISVYYEYKMRRCNCRKCNKVTMEKIPWGEGKNRLTNEYRSFLASYAKDMAWKTVASRFKTSWQTVYRSVKKVVEYGLENRKIDNVTAIGIDEVKYKDGHKYITLVYQIDKGCRRLLWMGKNRTKKTLRRFFADTWNEDRRFRKNIKVACTDMWKAYLTVLKEKIPNAINVLDKFHIMQKLGDAVDTLRKNEVRRLRKAGDEVTLKHSRWCLLKRKFNLNKSEKDKIKELVSLNLNVVKGYLLKEQFHKFWEYKSPTWAKKFLNNWCGLVYEEDLKSKPESNIEQKPKKNKKSNDKKKKETKPKPIFHALIQFTKTLKRHEDLILNYFRAKKEFNSGIVEGLNRNVNLTVRKAYGYSSYDVLRIALFHQMGKLPEPYFKHEFW